MGRADVVIEVSRSSRRQRRQSSSLPSPSPTTPNRDHVMADVLKDMDLYLSAKNGSTDDFRRVLNRISAAENTPQEEILSRVSPAGNTFLHVAAKHGNLETLTHIIEKSPLSVFHNNDNGDTALHLASEAGDESKVRVLVRILRRLDIIAARNDLVMERNRRGNTALLAALSNGREMVAEYWIREFPELSWVVNEQGESAVYLAAKASFANCVAMIVESCTNEELMKEQFKKKSPFKVAIMMKNKDMVEAMLSRKPSLIHLQDEEGETPLHYAVSFGDVEGVRFLLDNYAPSATQRNNRGFYPIHLAAFKDRVDILKLLLRYCPAPGELLDVYGGSILHVAAKYGSHNVVKYILKNSNLEDLINMTNQYGHTALHLAAWYWRPKIVSILTWDKRVDVTLLNYMGRSALDIVEDHISRDEKNPNPPFRQRLTWIALKSGGTPRSLTVERSQEPVPEKSYTVDFCKERVNTLLVVSTLVATITFAAGFTMPGGYNSSSTDLGMATLLRRRVFHLFVICDTIAMHSSIFVAVALIFAQLGDLNLVLTALSVALPLLGLALSMMSMAFTAGISLVVGKLRWLSVTVLVMGFTFLAVLLFLFLPLFTCLSSSNRILRYLSYYSFCFFMWATRSYDSNSTT